MSAKKTKKGLRRPLLVFINPASGTKLAGKMFHTIVQPHLDERHLTYQALETEYAGHAEELVMSTKGTIHILRQLIYRPFEIPPPPSQCLIYIILYYIFY